MSLCRSCRAPIEWVKMASGKAMPINVPGEKRVVIEDQVGRVVDTYVSHFATCRYAESHRRKSDQ